MGNTEIFKHMQIYRNTSTCRYTEIQAHADIPKYKHMQIYRNTSTCRYTEIQAYADIPKYKHMHIYTQALTQARTHKHVLLNTIAGWYKNDMMPLNLLSYLYIDILLE